MRRSALLFVCVCMLLSMLCMLGSCGDDDDISSSDSTASSSVPPLNYLDIDIADHAYIRPELYLEMAITLPETFRFSEELVERQIQNIMEQYPVVTYPTDRAVENGDIVGVYYTGRIDGVAFEGGTYAKEEGVSPFLLPVGKGYFIPGFEEGLIGHIPADTQKNHIFVTATFPDDYEETSLAGKTAEFEVEIAYIVEEGPPAELTEEYITETLGFVTEEEDKVAAFRAYVYEQTKIGCDDEFRAAVIARLMEDMTLLSYPQQDIDYQYQELISMCESMREYYNEYYYFQTGNRPYPTLGDFVRWYYNLEDGVDPDEFLRAYTRDMVRENMVYAVLYAQEGMTMTEEELVALRADLSEMYMREYGFTQEQCDEYMTDEFVILRMMQKKSVEFLKTVVTVTYTPEETDDGASDSAE